MSAVQIKSGIDVKKIAVIGSGVMGAGIAQVSAQMGVPVIMTDLEESFLQKGKKTIEESLSRIVKKGGVTEEAKKGILDRITTSSSMQEAKDADLVIEAVNEEMGIKKEVFQALDRSCKPEAILATNTSSLSVTELALVTRRPERVLGLHFFNPVPVMKLVEVVRTPFTSDDAFQAVWDVAKKMGKEPIAAKDTPGFIFNRLIIPYLNEAMWALYEGVGSVEDIDKAMKLGGNMPIGPLGLLDLVGIDVQLHACETFYREFGDPKFRPCPLNRLMVRAKRYGRKTGKGFYDYSTEPPTPLPVP